MAIASKVSRQHPLGAAMVDSERGHEAAANLHGANRLMDDWAPARLYVKGDTHASQGS